MKYLPSLNYCCFKPKLSCKGHPADFIHIGKLIAIPTGSILQPVKMSIMAVKELY